MKSAKYLFRLDDACPYLNLDNWNRITQLFLSHSIFPLIALIPDCQDSELKNHPFYDAFWDLVQKWKRSNIPFALHGYQHLFHKSTKSIISINDYSEFSGLSLSEQKNKIKKGYDILKSKDIDPIAWVAPAHSFDVKTLTSLLEETPIRIISDGFSLYPYKDKNFIWVPQQFWKPRTMHFGVYTICFHPNEMNEQDFTILENFLMKNSHNSIPWENIAEYISPNTFIRKLENQFFMHIKIIKKRIKNAYSHP